MYTGRRCEFAVYTYTDPSWFIGWRMHDLILLHIDTQGRLKTFEGGFSGAGVGVIESNVVCSIGWKKLIRTCSSRPSQSH